MKLLVESNWWDSGPPSGRNVLHSIVTAWAEATPTDDLTLSHSASAGRVRGALRAALPTQGLRTVALDLRGYDAAITQNFGAALKGRTRQGVFVHDVMWTRHPEWFTARERAYLGLIRPSLKRADIIFTSSRTEAEHIVAIWPETRDRVVHVGLSVPLNLLSAGQHPVKLKQPGRPYLLSVGRLNRRKNIARLVDAYYTLVRPSSDVALVVVGSPDGATETVPIPNGAQADIQFTGSVTDAELQWLYRNASAFVFPSLDEGFGLPLIEARTFGLPTVASDIPVFREVGADEYFDPSDSASIAAAVLRALQPDRPQRPSQDPRPEWHKITRRMRAALKER